jgi:hypothetical protein
MQIWVKTKSTEAKQGWRTKNSEQHSFKYLTKFTFDQFIELEKWFMIWGRIPVISVWFIHAYLSFM